MPAGPGSESSGGSRFVLRQPRGPDGTRGFVGLRGSKCEEEQSGGKGVSEGQNASVFDKESQQLCLESTFSSQGDTICAICHNFCNY